MLQLAQTNSPRLPRRGQALQAHLLGYLEYQDFVQLQRRLVFDTASRADGRITLLICEHPPLITLGRDAGSTDVEPRGVLLAGQGIETVAAPRGGGAVLHAPGQLAVYPIVPLDWYGWSVGEFMLRFQAGFLDSLRQLETKGVLRRGRYGVWGESGQIVTFGIAVRDWITSFGGHLQVAPPLPLAKFIVTDPLDRSPLGSLSQERKRAARMSTVRSRLVRCLADAFDCDKYHLYTGHPLLSLQGRFCTESSVAP